VSVQVNYAARSDVGLVRSTNQDSGYAGPHLLVLADGMGGPAGGDIASSVAVAHLAPLDDDVHPADDLLDLLREAVEDAHDELMERSQEDPALAGLGTTCIALLRSNNKLGMVHIGDSRAYLLRGGILTQATTDHTYVQHLVDTGRITPEEAAHHPNRNMIMRALGDNDGEVLLDESIREARPGDRWLLCSDGLSGLVAADTIEETLASIPDPGACADKLVDLALRAGGTDNVTVVIADVIRTDDIDHDNPPPTVPQVVGAAATDRLARSRAAVANSSAAARAAALTPAPPAPDDDAPPRRRRRLGRVIGLFTGLALILGLVAAGGVFGYEWTQTQYFVSTDDGHVAIYRGIPQEIGPLTFATLLERTDIAVADLPTLAQDRLQTPITRQSLAGAESVVKTLRDQLPPEPEPEPTAEPSPSPSSPEASP
jgi:protein phosphatase